jgi:hypothetical protein
VTIWSIGAARVLAVAVALAAVPSGTWSQEAPRRPLKIVSQYDNGGCGPGYPFDADGVVQVDYPAPIGRQYNPVTISQFALGCYHNYKRTGSEVTRKIYLDQIRWLMRSWVDAGPGLAAYEYKFAWSYGLAAGWRSGLAQAQAISALIRYQDDTGDPEAIPLMRRLYAYMMLPRSSGGLVATSREGGPWIEEFPSDPPSFVWNGFVSATFALYEYAQLFRDDQDAHRNYASALDSLRASISAYDTGNWTVLDRRSRPYPGASNGYQIGHAHQLKTLGELTGGKLFTQTWLRWQSFYTDVMFDGMGTMSVKDGIARLAPRRTALLPPDRLAGNAEVVEMTPVIDGHGLPAMLDRSDQTYFAPGVNGESVIHLRLRKPFVANYLALGIYNPTLYPKALKISIRACSATRLEPVRYELAMSRLVLGYFFDDREVCEVRLSSSDNAGQQRLIVSELALDRVTREPEELPAVGSLVTQVHEMSEASFTVRMTPATKASTALYRCGDTAAGAAQNGWIFDMLDPGRGDSRPFAGKFCQFKFISDPASAAQGWRATVEGGKALP